MLGFQFPTLLSLVLWSNVIAAFSVVPVDPETNQTMGTYPQNRKVFHSASLGDRSKSIDSLLDSLEKISDPKKQEDELDKLLEGSHLSSRSPMTLGKKLHEQPPQQAENRQFFSRILIYIIQRDLRRIIFEDRIAHVIRIIFHDCVGGCDGCLNRDLPPNMTPMLTTLDRLDDLYDSRFYRRIVSRADFYVLASITALEVGVNNANVGCHGRSCINRPQIRFRFGRRDCPTSPTSSESRTFPRGRDDFNAIMAFFSSEFGLGPRLGTALSGAHTLGGASGASGFIGFWKENAIEAAKFDARYFSLMADQNVDYDLVEVSSRPETNANSPRWQWEGFRNSQQVSFMLNSDVALLLDIQPDADGRSSCDFDTCQPSATALLVRIYGRFPNFWIRDFSVAFTRMVEN